jgi:hypothetical protein
VYAKHNLQVNCRIVDSVFFTDPGLFGNRSAIVITDNYPLQPVAGRLISLLPEIWSIWLFESNYVDRPATKDYNCLMNRPRGDRSIAFYELIKRNLLDKGFVSYNCCLENYQQTFDQLALDDYLQTHIYGKTIIPYNTVESHGSLEQCIVDSKISLILETYTSDSHIVFSEKLFRCLQLPRPWLLYCSPGSIELLQSYGFDVLDDYMDTSYDKITIHSNRLKNIMDQLEKFINVQYNNNDYARFAQMAKHNQQLLKMFAKSWPEKFKNIKQQIQQL